MKVLGQEGLNFIGQKYKELKGLISNKVDKIDGKKLSTNDYDNVAKAKVDKIPENPKYTDTTYDLSSYAKKTDIIKNLSQLVQDSNNRTVTDNEKTNWNNIVNKVDKVEGKGLSANDYDNTAKAKVDAIPASPKYTDTTYGVATTTNNGLMASSDKQALNNLTNNFAGVVSYSGDLNNLFKAGIYSCRSNTNKPSAGGAYATCIVTKADTTVEVSNTDSIQIWIDNKNGMYVRNSVDKTNAWTGWKAVGGGGTLSKWTFGQSSQCIAIKQDNLVVMYVNGRDFANLSQRPTLPENFRPAYDYFRNASSLSTGEKELAFDCGGGTYLSILSSGLMRLIPYGVNSSTQDALAANIMYFTD